MTLHSREPHATTVDFINVLEFSVFFFFLNRDRRFPPSLVSNA